MKEKYGALMIVYTIYKYLGYALIAFSIILAILFWNLASQHSSMHFVSYQKIITVSLLVGLFGSLIAFTNAKIIQLLMDIEKNTRA